MYCNDIVICIDKSDALMKVLDIIGSFTEISGLEFTFIQHRISNQTVKFIETLPSKYLRIKKLNLFVFEMKSFFNSHIMSKVTFRSQCKVYYESEWSIANSTAHRFCFNKYNKPRSMKMNKTHFLISEGGFDLCLPSKRTEASIVTLFFYVLQNSPILQSVIMVKSSLSKPSQLSPFKYFDTSSS
eukprot:TRINITY_DN1299_c0_g1_i12.p1 TRINITY_DN1299_c0_g1~~TRINITY_DN1299_c0_g1_i12.p1  ORF type:complete len:185 (+),score=15.04 TRINITY_DN1299_c0_g1_i12:787-1341(+)